MDNLENQWKTARQTISTSLPKPDELIKLAVHRKKGLHYLHFGNIIIFTVALVFLWLFFNSINLKDNISKIGIFLMFIGLSVRLVVEVISTTKSKNIQLINNTSATTNKALSFYSFRKRVHGPVTIITVVLYVTGFYLLSPEFSSYMSIKGMILMHVFFIVAALVLIVQGKKGMAKEMNALKSLIDLKKEINND